MGPIHRVQNREAKTPDAIDLVFAFAGRKWNGGAAHPLAAAAWAGGPGFTPHLTIVWTDADRLEQEKLSLSRTGDDDGPTLFRADIATWRLGERPYIHLPCFVLVLWQLNQRES